MAKVIVAIEIDSTFVGLLRANLTLSNDFRKPQLEPKGQLAILVLGEAMGGNVDEIDAMIQDEWLGHIRVLHDRREVTEQRSGGGA